MSSRNGWRLSEYLLKKRKTIQYRRLCSQTEVQQVAHDRCTVYEASKEPYYIQGTRCVACAIYTYTNHICGCIVTYKVYMLSCHCRCRTGFFINNLISVNCCAKFYAIMRFIIYYVYSTICSM